MIVTLLLICLFLITFHHYIVHFGRDGRLIDCIPGPMTFPIVGNILRVSWTSSDRLWKKLHDDMRFYSPIIRFWIFSIPIVIIIYPDDMEKMLNNTKHTEKGFLYKLLHPWLGDGLLTSKGIKWQERRKLLTPAFHFSILKKFTEILVEVGNRATKSLNNTEESVIENLMFFTSHHTLNAICETSMGTSLQDIGLFEQRYRYAVQDMSKIIFNRIIKPWLLSDTIFGLTSLSRLQTKCLNILHSFTKRIIEERKGYHEQTGGQYLKHFENNIETRDAEVSGIKKKRMAMLDILIAESRDNRLSDSEIREEVDTFLFEGHDTVAVASCFVLLLLAEHKNIQDCVRKEISEVMRENNEKLTMSALQNLLYLERCLKEAMRIYPSVPHILRICSENVKLQTYVIPKGTTVFLDIYDLHHDPNFWPNPEAFDPDRFLPENTRNRHPYAYLPFSAGPRNCIGQRFAMLELKALIAPLVYNFYLEPIDYLKDIQFLLDIVLRPSRPIRMKVIPIKRAADI